MGDKRWLGPTLLLVAAACSGEPGNGSDAGLLDGSVVVDGGTEADTDTDSIQDSDVDTDTESDEGEIVCNGAYCDALTLYCECMVGSYCGSSHSSVKECVEKEALFEKACKGDFSDFISCRLGCCQAGTECQDINGCFLDNQCSMICL